jgi:hypothetical protein
VSQVANHESLGTHGRIWLTVLWTSFLAASGATMVFFAFVDPRPAIEMLAPAAAPPSRTALYSVGFFLFWMIAALSASLTAWLLSAPSRRSSH